MRRARAPSTVRLLRDRRTESALRRRRFLPSPAAVRGRFGAPEARRQRCRPAAVRWREADARGDAAMSAGTGKTSRRRVRLVRENPAPSHERTAGCRLASPAAAVPSMEGRGTNSDQATIIAEPGTSRDLGPGYHIIWRRRQCFGVWGQANRANEFRHQPPHRHGTARPGHPVRYSTLVPSIMLLVRYFHFRDLSYRTGWPGRAVP